MMENREQEKKLHLNRMKKIHKIAAKKRRGKKKGRKKKTWRLREGP